ncbi:MAG: hypothetical protein IJ317_03035 [Clostridia bacterium]|nr:hypothetical protein [Clostridia bacterium]
MNEEIEYAEMLEIPVSTVNVLRGKGKKARKTAKKRVEPLETAEASQDLKSSLIARVNGEESQPEQRDPTQPVTPFEGLIGYDESQPTENGTENEFSDRIDTVRLLSSRKVKKRRLLALKNAKAAYQSEEDPFENAFEDGFHETATPRQSENRNGQNRQNDPAVYAAKKKKRVADLVLKTEFALACVLSATVFLTNVFMPNSAINTFFSGMKKADTGDKRTYSDFTLSGVVSDLSDATVEITEAGVITFTDECMVYPAADGTVSSVTQSDDGSFVVKITHSDTFTGVVEGLNRVYYGVGESVKSNVPLGFTTGEKAVQVTMYSEGELLNCFEMTDDNCLVWVENK